MHMHMKVRVLVEEFIADYEKNTATMKAAFAEGIDGGHIHIHTHIHIHVHVGVHIRVHIRVHTCAYTKAAFAEGNNGDMADALHELEKQQPSLVTLHKMVSSSE